LNKLFNYVSVTISTSSRFSQSGSSFVVIVITSIETFSPQNRVICSSILSKNSKERSNQLST